jgi:hypothetical protein
MLPANTNLWLMLSANECIADANIAPLPQLAAPAPLRRR